MVLLIESLATDDRDEAAAPERTHLVPRLWRGVARRCAFLRRAFLRSPLISRWGDRRYDARRACYAPRLPRLDAAHRTVLAELDDAGVAVRRAHLPAHVVTSADRFVELLSRRRAGGPCVKATPRELASDPTLFEWGLSDHLLDLAECHIGLPVRYLGLEVKRETVNSAVGHSHRVVRSWHLDHEDRRIFKVIVYLSDVPTGAGPFGYVHQANSGNILDSTGGRSSHGVTDREMDRVVPRSQWKHVTGARMTAIHVDTGQVFHRVFPPTQQERYSMTFAYSSRRPYYTYSRLMLPRSAIHQVQERLSQRQWDALCVGRSARRR